MGCHEASTAAGWNCHLHFFSGGMSEPNGEAAGDGAHTCAGYIMAARPFAAALPGLTPTSNAQAVLPAGPAARLHETPSRAGLGSLHSRHRLFLIWLCKRCLVVLAVSIPWQCSYNIHINFFKWSAAKFWHVLQGCLESEEVEKHKSGLMPT